MNYNLRNLGLKKDNIKLDVEGKGSKNLDFFN
jgi:hypothetical protein